MRFSSAAWPSRSQLALLQSKDARLFLVKAKSQLPWYAQEQLATLLEQLDTLGKSLERAAAIAEKMAEKRGKEAELLSTIPGVDSLLAVTILACQPLPYAGQSRQLCKRGA